MHKPLTKLSLLAVGLVALSSGANAAPAKPRATPKADQRRPPPPHPPPQAALDACHGKQEGADCSFKAPRGTISGTCRTVKDDYFACVPSDAPPPPPEED
ncbi:MAG: hypothetical protein R3B07_25530 [Polyangiaceae bacterium]